MAAEVTDLHLVPVSLDRHGQQTLTTNGDETEDSKTDGNHFTHVDLLYGVSFIRETQGTGD